jgi:hypothetical protein
MLRDAALPRSDILVSSEATVADVAVYGDVANEDVLPKQDAA